MQRISDGSPEFVRAATTEFAWFLYDLDIQSREFLFVRTDRDEIAAQTFLGPDWLPASGKIFAAPVDAVAEATESRRPPSLHFIWHTSLCGSTLLTKLIEDPKRCLVLREPKVLVTLARAARERLVERRLLPGETFAATFKLLGKPHQREARLVVKPSNGANVLVREAARHTAGKSLFLYSDLSSFLVSVAKGGLDVQHYARRLFGLVAAGQPSRWSASELLQMTDLEIAALAWHAQIAELRLSWPALGDERAASLDCDAFLADPARTVAQLDAFFALELGDEHLAAVTDSPSLNAHAKRPGQAFNSQLRSEEAQATRRRLGADLDTIIAWSYRAWPSAPKGAPFAAPLMT